jgi:hypothetical protein
MNPSLKKVLFCNRSDKHGSDMSNFVVIRQKEYTKSKKPVTTEVDQEKEHPVRPMERLKS